MNMLDAINKRKSVRTYQDKAVANSALDKVHDLVKAYNQEGDLAMQLIIDGSQAFDGLSKSYGMFKNVKSLIALKGKKDDDNLSEKAGYYGEKLVLEMTKLGLGTCWVGGTFDRNNEVFMTKDDERIVCVIVFGEPAEKESMIGRLAKTISKRSTKGIEQMFKADSEVPGWFIEGMNAVAKAPSAMNKQPVMFTYHNDYDIDVVVDDNYFLIDKGIARLHFEIGANGQFENFTSKFKHNE